MLTVALQAGQDIAPTLLIVQKFYLQTEPGGVSVKPGANALLENVLQQVATNKAAEMDGKMSDALRNILFGPTFQEDLASRNIFRGRDLNVGTYGFVAKCFGKKVNQAVCCCTLGRILVSCASDACVQGLLTCTRECAF